MASKLTLQLIKAAKPRTERYTLWDSDVKGFGLRVNADGSKSYALKYLFEGRQRWHTIGKHGSPWTPDTARTEALRLLAQARTGIDPEEAKRESTRADLTVSELCDLYVEAARRGEVLTKFDEPKKTSTLLTDESRILRHIKPLLGKKRVRAVTSDDVERFLHDVAAGKTALDEKTGRRGRAIVEGGRGAATRTVGLLGGIFTFAVRRKFRPDNPVQGVKRFKDKRNERYLSQPEMARVGAVLAASEAAWAAHEVAIAAWAAAGRTGRPPKLPAEALNPSAANAVRLLLLTGMRKSEVMNLQWRQIDAEHGYLRLSTSKSGAKGVPVGASVLAFLAGLPRIAGNPHVFPGQIAGRPFVGLPRVWKRVCERAGLEGVRIHDLRHSFGATSASSGNSLLLLGSILGHRDPKTTQRYAHLARDPVRVAADQVSSLIANVLETPIDQTSPELRAPSTERPNRQARIVRRRPAST
ncbi:site-specific integrase [Methylobacterium sp. NEAU K]|uniref:tyrosine-type recombinase/integrase n=1 Tax=Methylobacterium sp. NEAU K TaxID=3064946 RepID=UPI002735332E|nr:site-specific integrase [Methylobacterium sp. NEAU K]MDP4006702.1 site-specific integrase [Methylobacterium sp. NEAU K]